MFLSDLDAANPRRFYWSPTDQSGWSLFFMAISGTNWLEVATTLKAYFLGLCKGICPTSSMAMVNHSSFLQRVLNVFHWGDAISASGFLSLCLTGAWEWKSSQLRSGNHLASAILLGLLSRYVWFLPSRLRFLLALCLGLGHGPPGIFGHTHMCQNWPSRPQILASFGVLIQ